jgi:hypothetical protein
MVFLFVSQAFGQLGWEERIGDIDGEVAEDLISQHFPNDRSASGDQIDTRCLSHKSALLLPGGGLVISDFSLSLSDKVKLINPGCPTILVSREEILKYKLAGRFIDSNPTHTLKGSVQKFDGLGLDRVEIVRFNFVVTELRIIDGVHDQAPFLFINGRTWHQEE